MRRDWKTKPYQFLQGDSTKSDANSQIRGEAEFRRSSEEKASQLGRATILLENFDLLFPIVHNFGKRNLIINGAADV